MLPLIPAKLLLRTLPTVFSCMPARKQEGQKPNISANSEAMKWKVMPVSSLVLTAGV